MEFDKFTSEDRESLAEFLGKPSLPTPHMALEEAETILKRSNADATTPIRNESLATALPHEHYGVMTENLLTEGVFESFFAVKRPEENNNQRGEGFFAFVNEWKEGAKKRFKINNNFSSNFALWLVEQVTPGSIHIYAFNKWNEVAGNAKTLEPNNPDRFGIEEKLNRWKVYEDTARVASFKQDAVSRTRLLAQWSKK